MPCLGLDWIGVLWLVLCSAVPSLGIENGPSVYEADAETAV